MDLYKGDVVLVKGRRRKTSALIILTENVPTHKIWMSKSARNNIRVKVGDQVVYFLFLAPLYLFSITSYSDIPHGVRIHVLPIDDTVVGLTGYLFCTFYDLILLFSYYSLNYKKLYYYSLK